MTYKRLLVEFDPERHQNVRVASGVDVQAAQQVNHAHIGLGEAGIAGSDYPIFFMKDGDSGQFRLIVLFGFRPGQNLFLHAAHWQATYLPVTAQSWPFYFGGPDRILCIDENSAHVATDVGEALFDDGDATILMNNIRSRADYHRDDLLAADGFTRAIVMQKLVSPVKLILEFANGREETVEGLYSVNQQSLSSLSGGELAELNVHGYLGAAFAMIYSLSQINRLQQLYNFGSEDRLVRIRREMPA